MKDFNEALRTQHNQDEEVTERVSEELARAKMIKRGADRDLMLALKLVIDMKPSLERA